MSLFQWGDVTENSVWLCDLRVLDLEKAASCLWSWLITCEAAGRMTVLFPWIINKPVSCMDGVRGAWHPLFFLSFVQQLCFLGQSFINSWRWWRRKRKWRLYFRVICFSPNWKVAPCFHIILAATVQRFEVCHGCLVAAGYRLGMTWRCSNQCSRWHIVLLHWGLRLTPSSSSSQGSLIPASPEYRKHFWFFRNSIFRQRWKKAKQI